VHIDRDSLVNYLDRIIKMQLLWLVAAIGFHLVSLTRVMYGFSSISNNAPLPSIMGLMLFAPVLFLGWSSRYLAYGILNSLLISIVFYAGYLFQVLDLFSSQGLSGYASVNAWLAGVLINSFGIPVGVCGSYLAFRKVATSAK
jgi:hypothetical protein